MTTRYRDQENDVSDEAVSACYRENEPESSPAWLNEKVIRQATSAAKSKRFDRLFLSLWRPVSFVATLGVSLMIVLQFNDAWVTGSTVSENPRSAAGELADVVEGSARRMRQQADTATDVLNLGSTNPSSSAADSGTDSAAISTMPISVRYCEIAQASSANDWWACILQLENDGRTAHAVIERELMLAAFPDFRPPE